MMGNLVSVSYKRQQDLSENLRDVNLLTFFLVKVALDVGLKVLERRLPRLSLLGLELLKSASPQPVLDVLLKPIVKESASAKPTCADSRLLDADRS